MFPGQGAQHPQMVAGLYRHDLYFRDLVDQGAVLLHSSLQMDIRKLIFSADPAAAEKLKETRYAQPATLSH